MSSIIGDSAGASRYASKLSSAASEVDRIAQSFQRAVGRSECRGALASVSLSFGSTVQQRSSAVEQEMRGLGNAVKSHSKWVTDTENELKDLERRIRAWAAAHPPSEDPLAVGPDASLIRYWPGHLSFEWRDLGVRLKNHGVWF